MRSSDSTWSGSAFFAPLSWAPAAAVSVVYSHPLQPRRFTRACPSAESSFPRAIPSALMRGHTHAQEVLPLLPTGIRVPRGHAHAQGKDALEDQFVRTSLRACHAQGRDLRFREGTDPRAPIYCGRHAPRGRPTECSEVAAAFEHWGERVEGSSTATWATCAAANSAPVSASKALYLSLIHI